jgi:hypothetical protein
MSLHKQVKHPEYVEGCFGCKVSTLELSTGDARGAVIESGTTQKKWDSELQAYRDARANGIQPGGTSRKHVEAAITASENLGRAYDGNTMPAAHKINNKVSQVMKEVGI